jgi:hypothetical protein
LGSDFKGNVSTVLYIVAIAAAFFQPVISLCCYGLVALIWFVPDKRIERVIKQS